MRDPLDYTEEELNSLSIEELNKLSDISKNLSSLWHTNQLAQKVLINSLYGSLANRHFPLFNEHMAAAITGNGRYFIQKLANYIEETLQKMYKSDKPYIIYGDTDSCVGNTVILTENGDITIESLYSSLDGVIEARGEDNFIKHIKTPIKAASVNSNKELEFKNITYAMKHKVKKRMYKIKCGGDEVIITEDHSMIVIRDDMLIEIKPKDVLKTDKLIKIKNNQSTTNVVCL